MARRPSTAPGPTRDAGLPNVAPKATAKSNRGSLNAFWSFASSSDKRSGGAAPGPQTLNSIAQTRANRQLSASPSTTSFIQVSLSDDANHLRATPNKLLTKSRRSGLFRSSGYVSDDNGSADSHSSHYAKRSDLLDTQRSPPPTGKTQLQSTPEEAQEVLDLSFQAVPDRARRNRGIHFISPPPIIGTHQDNSSTGNLQSPPSRSRSDSRSLLRPPPSSSSYAAYSAPPFISHSVSSSPVASSFSKQGHAGKPPRPDRNPARTPQRTTPRRPSTASGALEGGSLAREMMQPLAVPYLHPVKSTHVRTRLISLLYKSASTSALSLDLEQGRLFLKSTHSHGSSTSLVSELPLLTVLVQVQETREHNLFRKASVFYSGPHNTCGTQGKPICTKLAIHDEKWEETPSILCEGGTLSAGLRTDSLRPVCLPHSPLPM